MFEDLPKGHYSITEVIAPQGYVLSEKTWTQNVEWGQNATVVIPNTPKTSLEITKVDEFDSNKTLQGAAFELKDPTTGEVWTATTGSNGKATFGVGSNGNELTANKTYILTEVQPPNGYISTAKPKDVVLQNVGKNELTITNTPKTSLDVIKIDGDDGSSLQGAVFTLKDPTTGEVWQATTGANGKATFGVGSNGNELTAGKTYILQEIQAPNGYVLDTTEQQAVLKKPGVIVSILIKLSKANAV